MRSSNPVSFAPSHPSRICHFARMVPVVATHAPSARPATPHVKIVAHIPAKAAPNISPASRDL